MQIWVKSFQPNKAKENPDLREVKRDLDEFIEGVLETIALVLKSIRDKKGLNQIRSDLEVMRNEILDKLAIGFKQRLKVHVF